MRAVAGLIDKSLLVQAETSVASRPLYLMLETVRAFAALELGTAGERDDAREGLARYCLREAASAAEGLVGPAQAEWLNRARDDLDNYRRALQWLIEQRRPTDAIGIAYPLFLFWGVRGLGPEGLDWYERALALDPPSPAAECALVGAATMCYTLGQMDRARELAMKALARGRAVPTAATGSRKRCSCSATSSTPRAMKRPPGNCSTEAWWSRGDSEATGASGTP